MVSGVAVAVCLHLDGSVDGNGRMVARATAVASDGEGEDIHSVIGGSELRGRGMVCILVVGHNCREFCIG